MLSDQFIDLVKFTLAAKGDDEGAADGINRKLEAFRKPFEALSTEQRVEGLKKAFIVLKEQNPDIADLFKTAGNLRSQQLQIFLDVLEADPSTIDAKAHTLATMLVDNIEKVAKALRG